VTSIRWTPQAADDLSAIYDFISRDSETYARIVTERILDSIDQLEQFPLSGRVVPEMQREDIREIIERPYRIVYRATKEVVYVLTIFNSSRLLPVLPEM